MGNKALVGGTERCRAVDDRERRGEEKGKLVGGGGVVERERVGCFV